jgi:hypothetical protein
MTRERIDADTVRVTEVRDVSLRELQGELARATAKRTAELDRVHARHDNYINDLQQQITDHENVA